ncbi:MAG: DUF1992 domain-containing protein [Acidobacteria bacterium]|nr:DUF1992 domain-containing protein [Acidobacteriota bacterium]
MLSNIGAAVALIAERKIEEAMAEGEFENLAGRGQPLDLDEDRFEPADWRLANRMLRNAGIERHEISVRKEINQLRREVAAERAPTLRSGLRREMMEQIRFLWRLRERP